MRAYRLFLCATAILAGIGLTAAAYAGGSSPSPSAHAPPSSFGYGGSNYYTGIPSYTSPTHTGPIYTVPGYSYSTPNYTLPTYASPTYSAPTYTSRPSSNPSPATNGGTTGNPAYTFQPTQWGTVQVYRNGQLISTGTPESAATNYGYVPSKPQTTTNAFQAPSPSGQRSGSSPQPFSTAPSAVLSPGTAWHGSGIVQTTPVTAVGSVPPPTPGRPIFTPVTAATNAPPTVAPAAKRAGQAPYTPDPSPQGSAPQSGSLGDRLQQLELRLTAPAEIPVLATPIQQQPSSVTRAAALGASTPMISAPTTETNPLVGVVTGLANNAESVAIGAAVSSATGKVVGAVAGKTAGAVADEAASGVMDAASVYQGYKTGGAFGVATAASEIAAGEAIGALGTIYGGPAGGVAAQAATSELIDIGGNVGGTLLYNAYPSLFTLSSPEPTNK